LGTSSACKRLITKRAVPRLYRKPCLYKVKAEGPVVGSYKKQNNSKNTAVWNRALGGVAVEIPKRIAQNLARPPGHLASICITPIHRGSDGIATDHNQPLTKVGEKDQLGKTEGVTKNGTLRKKKHLLDREFPERWGDGWDSQQPLSGTDKFTGRENGRRRKMGSNTGGNMHPARRIPTDPYIRWTVGIKESVDGGGERTRKDR